METILAVRLGPLVERLRKLFQGERLTEETCTCTSAESSYIRIFSFSFVFHNFCLTDRNDTERNVGNEKFPVW